YGAPADGREIQTSRSNSSTPQAAERDFRPSNTNLAHEHVKLCRARHLTQEGALMMTIPWPCLSALAAFPDKPCHQPLCCSLPGRGLRFSYKAASKPMRQPGSAVCMPDTTTRIDKRFIFSDYFGNGYCCRRASVLRTLRSPGRHHWIGITSNENIELDNSMPKIKFHKIAAVAVLLATVAWVATGEFSSVGSAASEAATAAPSAPGAETSPLRTVGVIKPVQIEHSRAIRMSGYTDADQRAVLAARAAGVIEELPIKLGTV